MAHRVDRRVVSAPPATRVSDDGLAPRTDRHRTSRGRAVGTNLVSAFVMQPERVEPATNEAASPPRKRFEELLRARTERPVRTSPAPPRKPRTSAAIRPPRPSQHHAPGPASLRDAARREMDASARQRIQDGTVATSQATGRLETRGTELLRAALNVQVARGTTRRAELEATGHGPPVERPADGGSIVDPAGTAAATAGVAPTATREDRVERAMELVERIERFVRSGRPSLALTLRGQLRGRLEIERVAPGAITLRFSSRRARSEHVLEEIRQALEARGLSVRSLETSRATASAADACSPCP